MPKFSFGACSKQLLCNVIVTPVTRLMQRCPACKVFHVDVCTLDNELLDAPGISSDGSAVQPSLSPLVSLIYFIFGFGGRVRSSLLTNCRLRGMLWCCVNWESVLLPSTELEGAKEGASSSSEVSVELSSLEGYVVFPRSRFTMVGELATFKGVSPFLLL